MGATHTQFQSLVEDEIIIPMIDIPTIQSPWRRADGTALVAELTALAIEIPVGDKNWETIQRAKRRSGVRVGAIINAIRERRLQLGLQVGEEGYSGLCVLRAEIDLMIKATPRVKGLDDLTVAAFGRQIGMRDHGRFPALVTSGHTSATRKQNPITGLTQLYMTEADIAEFHERYFTLPTMALEYGIDRRALLARIKSSEIRPFKPNDQDYGHLYLRKDVEALLK